MNTWDVFFLFPGIVYFGFFWLLGSEQTKNRTGQKSPACFGAMHALILNFGLQCQYFFLIFFGEGEAGPCLALIGPGTDCCLP
jgi:hypothetical protein